MTAYPTRRAALEAERAQARLAHTGTREGDAAAVGADAGQDLSGAQVAAGSAAFPSPGRHRNAAAPVVETSFEAVRAVDAEAPANEAPAPASANTIAAAPEAADAVSTVRDVVSHGAHRGARKPWRTRPRMVAAGAAALFLMGSVMVATPANAATVPEANAVYASQLLASGLRHAQQLRVSGSVATAPAETQTFSSAGFTTPDGTPAVTVGGNTNADWAAMVLQDARLPVTPNNLTVMLQWMDSENDPNDWYLRNNPLNNGLGSGGGAGFGSYDTLTIAASYVAQQLTRSDGLFSGIYDALAANSPVSVTASAIWESAWAGSHYGYGSIWHAVDVPIVAAPSSDW